MVAMMFKKRRKLEIWDSFSVIIFFIYIIFLILPLISILKESIFIDGVVTFKYFIKFFNESYYLGTIRNSFKLSIATMVLSLLIGVPLAYVYNLFKIRGRNIIQILIILSSMSAPFVGAYAWILLFGRSGLITSFFQNVLNIQTPSIYGFWGIVIVLTTRLYPLVFMYVSGALRNIDNSIIEASQNLGGSTLNRFFKIIIPLCMPSILASGLLVFMRAMADFGTPLLLGEGFRTFPAEIYKQYVGETAQNHSFAATISVIAIIITALVFFVQKFLANKFDFKIHALNSIERKKPKIITSFFIHFYMYAIIAISILPQVYLVYSSFRKTNAFGNFVKGYSLDSYKTAFNYVKTALPNTIRLGFISLFVIILLSIIISYLVVRRRNVLNNTIDTMSMLPYVIPGSVTGIALVITFGKGSLVLTGTMAIMVIAMVIRRIPYTIRSTIAVLQQIPVTTEEASISLGASKMKTFFRITTPMMANGIVSGAILSWISIITELSSSIMLYSVKTQTLTLAIYVLVSRGTDGPASAVSTILMVFTILALGIFIKFSKDKEFTI